MFTDAAKTTEAIRDLVKPIALINDELKRTLLIKSISVKFNLREKLLESELEKVLSKNERQSAPAVREKPADDINLPGEKPKQSASFITVEYKTEKELIRLLFEGEQEIAELVFHHLQPGDFNYEAHRKIAEVVFNAFNNNEELIAATLVEKLDDETLGMYVRELTFDKHRVSKKLDELKPVDEQKTMLKNTVDHIRSFKINTIDKQITEIHKKIELAKDESDVLELLKLKNDLFHEKGQISTDLSTLNMA